ncbi:MAG: hypothetical protein KBD62_21930, partial [Kofleriaceae bacterium]|nr:hypothetical protein [Kofleriaceae bacterium]
ETEAETETETETEPETETETEADPDPVARPAESPHLAVMAPAPHKRRTPEVRSDRFGRGPQRMLGEGLFERPSTRNAKDPH